MVAHAFFKLMYTRDMARRNRSIFKGFTVIELLIAIGVIAILTAIVVISYNGVQNTARNAQRLDDMNRVADLLDIYYTKNGGYPVTTNQPQANWRSVDVRTDDNCTNGTSQADWIPGITEALPQSNQTGAVGADNERGCYLYASNGVEFVLSAWNMISPAQTSTLYRRQGFREFQTSTSTQFYTCNSNTVGGANGGYNINADYYKHSYTVTNITGCNETPPPGA